VRPKNTINQDRFPRRFDCSKNALLFFAVTERPLTTVIQIVFPPLGTPGIANFRPRSTSVLPKPGKLIGSQFRVPYRVLNILVPLWSQHSSVLRRQLLTVSV